jgi:hypothetical protein
MRPSEKRGTGRFSFVSSSLLELASRTAQRSAPGWSAVLPGRGHPSVRPGFRERLPGPGDEPRLRSGRKNHRGQFAICRRHGIRWGIRPHSAIWPTRCVGAGPMRPNPIGRCLTARCSMNVRILMVGVSGLVLAACSSAPGSSTGSPISSVDGVKGSLASAAAKSHDGGNDQGDDERDGSSCKPMDGGRSSCADDNGQGNENKGDASSCRSLDGGPSPCAQRHTPPCKPLDGGRSPCARGDGGDDNQGDDNGDD